MSSVVEEYGSRDDQRWRNCVSYKYESRGRDPWRYRGIGWSYEYYRDHDIIFNGGRVPVRAGAIVWSYADYEGYLSEFRLWLGGKDADLFEVSYHSEFEKIANEWRAASGGIGQRLAIWYVHPQPLCGAMASDRFRLCHQRRLKTLQEASTSSISTPRIRGRTTSIVGKDTPSRTGSGSSWMRTGPQCHLLRPTWKVLEDSGKLDDRLGPVGWCLPLRRLCLSSRW